MGAWSRASAVDSRTKELLVLPVLGSVPVVLFALYALTHPIRFATPPSLYLQMAESIANAGYSLPERVPYYTENGLPFAYPPLALFVLALVRDLTGLSYFDAARVLTLVYNVGYVLVFYALARDVLSTRARAAFAAFVFAVSPGIVRLHLFSGGGASGSVRALGYLLCLSTVLVAHRYYARPPRDRRYLPLAGLGFGLVLLTHPMYVPFTGVSVLLFYLVYDRSRPGLVDGAVIAGLGLLVASPWWGTVLARYGADVFLGAAGTHNGLGSGLLYAPVTVTKLWSLRATQTAPLSAWYLTPLAVAYFVAKRRWFLPLWLGTAFVINTEQRFHFLVEVLIATGFVFEGLLPWLRREAVGREYGRYLVRGLLVAMVLFAGVSSALYASGTYRNVYAQEYGRVSATPDGSTVDEQMAAAAWIRQETDPSATFLVIGPEEDLPYHAKRTVLVVPWGAEWLGPGAYARHHRLVRQLDGSDTASALSRFRTRHDLAPDYVYAVRSEFDERTFSASSRYTVVFENEAVVVARVDDGSTRN